jgi:hypothetical protein
MSSVPKQPTQAGPGRPSEGGVHCSPSTARNAAVIISRGIQRWLKPQRVATSIAGWLLRVITACLFTSSHRETFQMFFIACRSILFAPCSFGAHVDLYCFAWLMCCCRSPYSSHCWYGGSTAANYSLQPFTVSLQCVKGLCNYMLTACGHVSRVICIRLQP